MNRTFGFGSRECRNEPSARVPSYSLVFAYHLKVVSLVVNFLYSYLSIISFLFSMFFFSSFFSKVIFLTEMNQAFGLFLVQFEICFVWFALFFSLQKYQKFQKYFLFLFVSTSVYINILWNIDGAGIILTLFTS